MLPNMETGTHYTKKLEVTQKTAGRYTKKTKQQQMMTGNFALTYFGIMFPLAVVCTDFCIPSRSEPDTKYFNSEFPVLLTPISRVLVHAFLAVL